MGFNISPNSRQSGKRGRGQRYSQPRNTFTDINVTPFVDVMLVLLIVFMVAAPMMTMGVPVVLPKTTAGKINDAKKESVVVSVNEKGEMFIENELVAPPQLKPRLMMVGGMNPNLKVMVRADEKLPYGEVMKLMGFVSQAGFTQVSLIVQGANTPSSKARP